MRYKQECMCYLRIKREFCTALLRVVLIISPASPLHFASICAPSLALIPVCPYSPQSTLPLPLLLRYSHPYSYAYSDPYSYSYPYTYSYPPLDAVLGL